MSESELIGDERGLRALRKELDYAHDLIGRHQEREARLAWWLERAEAEVERLRKIEYAARKLVREAPKTTAVGRYVSVYVDDLASLRGALTPRAAVESERTNHGDD